MIQSTTSSSPLPAGSIHTTGASSAARKWLEYGLYALLFLATVAWSESFQDRISLHDGKGWDGEFYHTLAEQFADGREMRVEAPFAYRIGNPILAALIDRDDLLSGFKVANTIANVFSLAFFVVVIRPFIPLAAVRIILVLLFLTHWIGPFRFLPFYPASNDNFYHFFVLLGFVLIQFSKTRPVTATILLTISSVAGVFFRETTLLAAFAYPFVSNPIDFSRIQSLRNFQWRGVFSWPRFHYFLPPVLGLTSLLYLHLGLIDAEKTSYSFLLSVGHWAYAKPFPTFVQAMFVVYGPAIILVLFNWRQSWALLRQYQPFLVFCALSLFLIYFGGNDTERYWYGILAVVYILVGRALIDLAPALKSWPLALVLIVGQALCHRLFWSLPDYPSTFPTPFPVLTIPSGTFQYLDLYSFHGAQLIGALILLEYLALSALLLTWLAFRTRKAAAPEQSPL